MRRSRSFLGTIFLLLAQVSIVPRQTEKPADPATAPPKILLLVHQQFKFGSESARQKLAVSIVHASDRLDVPNSWIDLQSITGPPEALSFDPSTPLSRWTGPMLSGGSCLPRILSF
jgi:hypothetical protein